MRRTKTKNYFRSYKPNPSASNTQNEIELYLADENTDVASLQKYRVLKKVFVKYNASLPSSASVERLFSAGGLIFKPTGSNLSDANVEKMLFLQVNTFLSE